MTQTKIVLVNVTDAWKLRRNLRGVVGRTIIDQDHFIVWIVQFA